MKGYHIIAIGRVQGVGFRYYTQLKALELGLKGTVENKKDGSVEIFIEGAQEALIPFLKWVHEGPESAHVVSLEYQEIVQNGFESFAIVR